jgi:ABC-2 type transport system permease protein
MHDFFYNVISFFVRISAFISKEFFSVISQPRLVGVLVLGPFLILFLFGISYQNTYQNLRTAIVVPNEKDVEEYVKRFAEQDIPNIEIQTVTTEETKAISDLQNRKIDLVMVIPPNISDNMKSNQPSVFKFYHQEIDPFEISYVDIITNRLTQQTNRDFFITTVEQSKVVAQTYQDKIHNLTINEENLTEAENSIKGSPPIELDSANAPAVLWFLLQSLSTKEDVTLLNNEVSISQNAETERKIIETQLADFVEMDSKVLVEPFQHETLPLSKGQIEPVHFYIPSVLALLLQHTALSLAALSIVSERFVGTMEIMRASPTNAFEILVGKYLSFLIFLGILTALLMALLTFGLGVPMLGSWLDFTLASVLVILVSLGYGFLISSLVRSDSQAVQFSMVLLLGSIFFSGFFLQLYQLRWPAKIISWILPTTYGIKTLQDVMLRGIQPQIQLLLILAGMAVVLFLINWIRLNRLLIQR